MKRSGTATAIGLFLFLVQLRFATANLPGQSIWQPLSDVFLLIWPTYSGFEALTVDAVLLFVIIAMTVVEAGKKTKLPKVTAWGVGIALWLSAVIALQRTGVLLLEQPIIMFILFFLAVAGFYWLVKMLLELFLNGHDETTQRIVAFSFSVVMIGSFFQKAGLDQGHIAQDGVYGWIGLIVALCTVVLWVTLIILLFRLFKGKGGNMFSRNTSEGKAFKKLRKQSRKENKQRKELQNEGELENKHDEYLKQVEEQVDRFARKMLEEDEQASQTIEGIGSYAETIIHYAEEFEKQIDSYRDWMDENKTSLPEQYITRIEEIVKEWKDRVAKLKELLNQLLQERNEIDSDQIKKFEKAYEKEISSHNQLFSKLDKAKKELDKYTNRISHLDKSLLDDTHEQGIISEISNACPGYAQLLGNVMNAAKEVDRLEKKISEREEVLVQEEQTVSQQLKKCEDAIEEFEKSSEKSKTIIQELIKLLDKGIEHLQAAVKNIDKKQMSHSLSKFKEFKKEVHAEENEIGHRVAQEKILEKNHDLLLQEIDAYRNQYGQEINDLLEEIQKDQNVIAYGSTMQDLNKVLLEIDTEISSRKHFDKSQLHKVEKHLNTFKKESEQFVEPVKNDPAGKTFVKNIESVCKEILDYYAKKFDRYKNATDSIGGGTQ